MQEIQMISIKSYYSFRNWCFKNFVKTLSHPALNNYRHDQEYFRRSDLRKTRTINEQELTTTKLKQEVKPADIC